MHPTIVYFAGFQAEYEAFLMICSLWKYTIITLNEWQIYSKNIFHTFIF